MSCDDPINCLGPKRLSRTIANRARGKRRGFSPGGGGGYVHVCVREREIKCVSLCVCTIHEWYKACVIAPKTKKGKASIHISSYPVFGRRHVNGVLGRNSTQTLHTHYFGLYFWLRNHHHACGCVVLSLHLTEWIAKKKSIRQRTLEAFALIETQKCSHILTCMVHWLRGRRKWARGRAPFWWQTNNLAPRIATGSDWRSAGWNASAFGENRPVRNSSTTAAPARPINEIMFVIRRCKLQDLEPCSCTVYKFVYYAWSVLQNAYS